MRKHLFLLSCLLLLSGSLFAQSTEPEGYTDFDAISSSTQYPILGKEVTSGIDYYTGTANINVALYTISSYGFKIPISLQYAFSGKKNHSHHNTIATNWELTGVGYIKRTVKGRPDEKGWLTSQGAIASNSLASEWKIDAFKNKVSIRFDGEPDFYQYILPSGKSGGFVMNYDKSISLIPYQDIKVEWMNSSVPPESYFVITDTNGVKYYFGTSDNSREISRPYTGSGSAGPNDYISA